MQSNSSDNNTLRNPQAGDTNSVSEQTGNGKKTLRILQVIFENDIRGYEIPAFRGAVTRIAGLQNILFHNHEGNNFRYSYPLIQYKTYKEKPMLICIEQGVNEAHHFFENIQEGIMLGNRPYELRINSLNLFQAELRIDTRFNQYVLLNWLPFNQENYKTFNQLNNQVEEVLLLEKILTGNILSFAKGVAWRIDQEIKVRITEVGKPKPVSVKSVTRIAIKAAFQSNVVLPELIGLGKNVSTGFGTIRKNHTSNKL
ncbi:MAG: CRISPR-associated endonuclease Cas6 [Bacteroidales bacterium]|nr:CRISPR-associated endonuclease Cas6 [Bacteroidales bacterium]